MQQTNLEIKTIDPSDPLSPDPINENFAALDAATLRYKVGTYAGAGECGEGHPNRLEFDFKPLLVAVSASTKCNMGERVWVRGMSIGRGYAIGSTVHSVQLEWEDRALQWYVFAAGTFIPSYQFNEEGETYAYFAIGVAE